MLRSLIERALLDLCFLTHGFNDPIGKGVFAMLRCFSFGSSNIHGASKGAIPEKIKTSVKMDGTTEESEK
jgi:hypothetical protein